MGPKRAVPSVYSSHFKECLLESDREILLIFLISRKSVNIVDGVEVFRLDVITLSWIKIERLRGDRALFLGLIVACQSLQAKWDVKVIVFSLAITEKMTGGCMIYREAASLCVEVTKSRIRFAVEVEPARERIIIKHNYGYGLILCSLLMQ